MFQDASGQTLLSHVFRKHVLLYFKKKGPDQSSFLGCWLSTYSDALNLKGGGAVAQW